MKYLNSRYHSAERPEKNRAGFLKAISESQPFLFAMDDFKPEKVNRAVFVEKWAHAEQTSAFLGITIYALIVFCIVLSIVLFKVSTKPQAIYYIPGAREAGVAYPNRIENGSVLGFASGWLLDRNNFTPVTVKETYIRAMRYMAPELLSGQRPVWKRKLQELNVIISHRCFL